MAAFTENYDNYLDCVYGQLPSMKVSIETHYRVLEVLIFLVVLLLIGIVFKRHTRKIISFFKNKDHVLVTLIVIVLMAMIFLFIRENNKQFSHKFSRSVRNFFTYTKSVEIGSSSEKIDEKKIREKCEQEFPLEPRLFPN